LTETGAGKSIILDAIDAALGAKLTVALFGLGQTGQWWKRLSSWAKP